MYRIRPRGSIPQAPRVREAIYTHGLVDFRAGWPTCSPPAACHPLSGRKLQPMRENHLTFLSRAYLRSQWNLDYLAFRNSPEEAVLYERLVRWSKRTDLGERSAEPAFLDEFFRQTWDYVQAGQDGGETTFSLYPQFPVSGAGSGGGIGVADAALGHFQEARQPYVPQVVCEFKDIRINLDSPQRRKANTRSPVRQALDYLAGARRGLFGHEPILPMWALVTDMNEFRLYWHDRGDRQYIRFTIYRTSLFDETTLLDEGESARFDRFLFWRVFRRSTLLVDGTSGRPPLFQLIQQQHFSQRELENTFYGEYRDYRAYLYHVLLRHNDENSGRFPGTRGRLVRLAQKFIDRCIFIFFCEDMGRVLGFPPQLLRNFLADRSADRYLDPEGGTIWEDLKALFRAMNDGRAFGGEQLNQFNGGLFAPDPDLEQLRIPNIAFCEQGQAQNEASLSSNKRTLLYLSAAYNYATGWADGLARGDGDRVDPTRSLGLYTLGRIFEQSITELEILEAEADGRLSVNILSKRKRDGVYYTPEWVVERIVEKTIGRRLADLKRACGWPAPNADRLPTETALDAYVAALREVCVVDPACGSGAFLIMSLRFLLDEWQAVREVRRQVTRDFSVQKGFEDMVVRDLLRRNIYGVDINPASVEITKLALWLHTARGDRPLSSLDDHIREGNSLIGPEFYDGLAPYSDDERERINAFDWQAAFPEVFARGGFDAVVGNPPYVKLQNFRRVHSDMTNFLQRRLTAGGHYVSTQTGSFDLYLPFIEMGISLLSDNGHLGFIAPSLWTMNEYGEGLRRHVIAGQHLWGWIDFGAYQVFDEATTYTALQFFSRAPNDSVSIALANDGVIPEQPWSVAGGTLSYDRLTFGRRWLLTTGADREVIDRLVERCLRLDDLRVTRHIFVGIQTSADAIFHLRKIGPRRYVCTPKGGDAPPPYEVRIEDDLMKPLVSGTEAKRYVEPRTDTYLLFPYAVTNGRATLLPAARIAAEHPLAWSYLQSWEAHLRSRENGAFDDQNWYRFGRHQNLDKQELQKLVVPRLVPTVNCSVDANGSSYLDNVDVGGVTLAPGISPFFLAGVLNGPVASFVFRRISKPFRGNYRSANRQFIAPLPIPDATDQDASAVARIAEQLQQLHTHRRNILEDIGHRLSVLRQRRRSESWLFPDLPSLAELQNQAPNTLGSERRNDWACLRFAEELAGRHERLGSSLTPGVHMSAELADGELRFLVDGVVVVDRVFVDDEAGPFIAAQWKVLATSMSVTASTNGAKLSASLRRLAVATGNPEAVRQIIELGSDLDAVEAQIADAESEINRLLYALYDLNPDDVGRIEAG